MKTFNTTGVCIPSKHYMVDITDKVLEIKKLVDAGKYFTINRARQYGKTTILNALKNHLNAEYMVLSLDFQKISSAGFAKEETFVQEVCGLIWKKRNTGLNLSDEMLTTLKSWMDDENPKVRLGKFFDILLDWCEKSEKRIVLIIDEVDSSTNNQVFLDFLSQLRDSYIARDTDDIKTFWSIILAGVTDIRHLKSKIRPEEQHKVNSPWNIAADFDVDMSLSENGIKGMLDEYEADHRTGMDTAALAKYIREYTNGYPFLVSRICQLIDTKLVKEEGIFGSYTEAWTLYGIDEAVKRLLSEENTLFESLTGKLINLPGLKKQLKNILLRGETYPWLTYDPEQQLLNMYGFIRNNHNTVALANRIFEMLLYTLFIGEQKQDEDLRQLAAANKSIFIDEDGWLDIPKIMQHFIKEHNIIHGEDSEKFIEQEGRERFLTYISPIINGIGTYSVEEQTRDHRRMDVVIHYLGRRYIIELKIWHGERYNEEGEKQIKAYLDYFGLSTGFLLSFNFNKTKTPQVERIQFGDKVLFEGIV